MSTTFGCVSVLFMDFKAPFLDVVSLQAGTEWYVPTLVKRKKCLYINTVSV